MIVRHWKKYRSRAVGSVHTFKVGLLQALGKREEEMPTPPFPPGPNGTVGEGKTRKKRDRRNRGGKSRKEKSKDKIHNW